MQDYQIEYDVKLWDYVIRYNGETYPLNCQDVREAYHMAQLKLSYLTRLANE